MIRIFAFLLILFAPSLAVADESCPKTVSIGGALTEIIYKLDKQECLVGADTTSTYPVEAKALPMVGYQRQLSAEGILSLGPELIIHTAQAGPPAVLDQIDQAGITRLPLDDEPSIDGVIAKIKAIGDVYAVQGKADALIAEIEDGRAELAKQVKDAAHPKVVFIMQHAGVSAPMVAGKGTAADAIITLAGGENIASFPGYKSLTPEAMIELNPDVILTSTESLEQAGGVETFLDRPGFKQTKAGQNETVVAMDALLLLGFGPRTVDAAKELSLKFQNTH